MRINEFDNKITPSDLEALETFADRIFGKVGIDVEFTRHFLDRVNDERNGKQITASELTRLFKQEYKKWGQPIAKMGPDAEAVMKDLATDINMPFALVWDKENEELDLIVKTVMRKKDFKTSNREFEVESGYRMNGPSGLRSTGTRRTDTKYIDIPLSSERPLKPVYSQNPLRKLLKLSDGNPLSSEENDDINKQRQNDLDKTAALVAKFAQIEKGRKAKAIEDPIKYKMDADNSASKLPYKHYRTKAASYAANVKPEYYFEDEEDAFEPHMMYKGDKKKMTKTNDEHIKLGKKGWSHDNPKTKKVDEDSQIWEWNKEEPNNPEVLIQGYGRLMLNQIEASVVRKLAELTKMAERGDFEQIQSLLDRDVMQTMMKAIVDTKAELQATRKRGGPKSRGINRESILDVIGKSEVEELGEESPWELLMRKVDPKIHHNRYQKAAERLHSVLKRKETENKGKWRHALGWYVSKIADGFKGIDSHTLQDYYLKNFDAVFEEVNETGGVGKVVPGVNTTIDVGPDEIKKQAAKFGNKVSKDGLPKNTFR